MFQLKPLSGKLVVQKLAAVEQTEGGIYLPDSCQQKPLECIVMAIGEILEDQPPVDYKVGDLVYVSRYSGTDLKIAGKEYVIISENDVIAIIEE